MYYLSQTASFCYQNTASALSYAASYIPEPVKSAACSSFEYVRNINVIEKVQNAVMAKIFPATPNSTQKAKEEKLRKQTHRVKILNNLIKKKMQKPSIDNEAHRKVQALYFKTEGKLENLKLKKQFIEELSFQQTLGRLNFHISNSLKILGNFVAPGSGVALSAISGLGITLYTTVQQEIKASKLPNDEEFLQEKREVRKNTLITLAWTTATVVAGYFLLPYVSQTASYLSSGIMCEPGTEHCFR